MAGESLCILHRYEGKASSVPTPSSQHAFLQDQPRSQHNLWWQLGPVVHMVTAANRKVSFDLPIHPRQSQQPVFFQDTNGHLQLPCFLQDTLLLSHQSVMTVQYNPLRHPCPLSTVFKAQNSHYQEDIVTPQSACWHISSLESLPMNQWQMLTCALK